LILVFSEMNQRIIFPQFFILICFVSFVQSQNRVAFEVKNFESLRETVVLEDGFIVFSQDEVAKEKYHFEKYNFEFEQEWKVDIEINKKLNYKGHSYSQGNLYLIFHRYQSHNYQIIRLNTGAGFLQNIEIYSLNKIEIEHLAGVESDLYVIGKTNNDPIALHFDLKEKRAKILPLTFKGKPKVNSLKVDEKNKLVVLNLASRYRFRLYQIHCFLFQNGKEKAHYLLESNEKTDWLTGEFFWEDFPQPLIIGLFKKTKANAPQGVFVSKIGKNGQIQETKQFPFLDFENFLSFLEESQISRIEKNAYKKKSKGDLLEWNYNYDFSLQKINSESFLLKLIFKNEEYVSSLQGRREVVVFKGFAGKNLFWIHFKKQEARLKNGGYDIEQVLDVDLNQNIQLNQKSNQNIQAIFLKEKTWYIQNFDPEGKNLEIIEEEMIANDAEKITNLQEIKYKALPEGEFLLWGYQTLKREANKKVYFIEKINFE